jgi:hypothetical protein
VLGLGDSISDGPEEGAFSVPPRPWAQWVAEALDLPFHRLAEAGTMTPWMAAELLPRTRDDYALACVHAGTNDVRSVDWDAATYEAALARILTTLALRAQRVCVATIPLDLGRPRAGAKVADLNAIVRRLAAEHGAVVAELDDLRGFRFLLPDAVHPTALGQLEIARRAARALGLGVEPGSGHGPDTGRGGLLRYAVTRQPAHLARDWRRRMSEGTLFPRR